MNLSSLTISILLVALGSLAEFKSFKINPVNNPAIHFYFDRPKHLNSYPIVVFLQGSECRSIRARYNFPLEPSKVYNAGFLLIEKPGITDKQIHKEDALNCTHEFRRLNRLDQRLVDALLVIDHIRKTDNNWNRMLLIIGGSEGGMLAPILAKYVPETLRVAMLVAGNGRPMVQDTREALVLTARKSGMNPSQISELIRDFDQKVMTIKQNPQLETLYLSHTYKWWNSVLWIEPLKYMLSLNIPQLLVHGTKDTSVPVISARLSAQAFKSAGRKNLTYWEYPGLDHGLTDADGTSFRADILDRSLKWLLKP